MDKRNSKALSNRAAEKRMNAKLQDRTPTPPFLHHIPGAVVRALDLSDAFHSALIATGHRRSMVPVIVLGEIESYFEAAKRQQQRIKRAGKRSTRRHRSLFSEVHFYLVCWARIAKLARFIANETKFRRTRLVLRCYHTELTDRIDGRDHLEHFEERLPGGPMHHKLLVQRDLLNMTGEFLTYGGRKIDVGSTSISLLRGIVAEFRKALLFDSIEVLQAKDLNGLASILRRAGSRLQIARLMRQIPWDKMDNEQAHLAVTKD
jgi:hypothetical protein